MTFARAMAAHAGQMSKSAAMAKPAAVSHQAMRRIQRKPAVGVANDPLEYEADRVADQVLQIDASVSVGRSAPPIISRKCSRCGSGIGAAGKCDDCDAEEKTVQRKANGGASAIDSTDAAGAVAAGGRPLPLAERAYFEARFGRDFSGVRIHTHDRADTAARAIDARAYTLGTDIAFTRGAFAPGTQEGDRLIAHELAHVVQQTQNPGLPVQRRPALTHSDNEKPAAKIVKIVVEAGSLAATTTLSDGTIGSLALKKNEMPPGEYQFTKDPVQTDPKFTHYTSNGPKNGFIWNRAVVGDSVRVVIVPTYVEDFLRAHEVPYGPAAGPRDNLRAAEILTHFGVTKGELLRELQKEEENDRTSSDKSVDATDWALSFVAQTRGEEREALVQHETLLAAASRLSRIRAEPDVIRTLLLHLTDQSQANLMENSYELYHPPYGPNLPNRKPFDNEFDSSAEAWATLDVFADALDKDLHALTEAMLNEASATIFEVKRRFIGTRALGIGEGYLEDALADARKDPEIASARTEITNKKARKKEIAARQQREMEEYAAGSSGGAGAGSRSGPDANMAEAERAEADRQVQTAKDRLRLKFSQRTKIDITGVDEIDPEDLLTSPSGEDAQIKLKDALWKQEDKINTARRRLRKEPKFVYRADKIIALEKTQLGIQPGSVLDRIVDGIVEAKRSSESFWSELWEVISFIVSFVPPPAGPIMRAVVAGINLISALDEHADQTVAHDTKLASSGPGSLAGTFLLTAAGTLFDAGELTGLSTETKALSLGLETETAGTRAIGTAERTVPAGEADLEGVADESAAAVKAADPIPSSIPDTFSEEIDEAAKAVKFAEEHPQKPVGDVGSRSIDVGGGHRIVEVEEEATGAIACEFHSDSGPRVPCPAGMGDAELDAVVDALDQPQKVRQQAAAANTQKIQQARQDAQDAFNYGDEAGEVSAETGSHKDASARREAEGLSGDVHQSAHSFPTAYGQDKFGNLKIPGYSREEAETILLERQNHNAFDQPWKKWSREQRKLGNTKVTVEEFEKAMSEAILGSPITEGQKSALQIMLHDEMFEKYGLKLETELELPYSSTKPLKGADLDELKSEIAQREAARNAEIATAKENTAKALAQTRVERLPKQISTMEGMVQRLASDPSARARVEYYKSVIKKLHQQLADARRDLTP